jgi:hypothetical protein
MATRNYANEAKIMQIFEISTFFAKTLQHPTKLHLQSEKIYNGSKNTLTKIKITKKKCGA